MLKRLPILLILVAFPAAAQTEFPTPAPGRLATGFVQMCLNASGQAQSNCGTYGVPTPFTVGGAAVAVGRAVGVYATAAGTVTFIMAGGTSYTVPVAVGYQIFPFAVTGASAATVTATYANLN